jgi:hypothetical protein
MQCYMRRDLFHAGINHPSVYHTNLDAMQLVEHQKGRKCLSRISSHER